MRPILPILFLTTGISLAPAGQTAEKMKEAVGGQQLAYWLHQPEGDAPEGGWPILLFLHGAGERGSDLEQVKVHGPPKLIDRIDQLKGCVVVSPQCPTDGWWRSETLKALLDEVIDRLDGQIDRSRVYCTGLSMGGYGTWNMVLNYPDLLAAAAPICGGGDISRLKAKVKRGFSPTFDLDKLKAAKELPIWAFHGAADGVVPQAESELLVDALKKAGSRKVKLTSYPGVGHNSWSKTYGDPKFYEWMFAQRRAEGE